MRGSTRACIDTILFLMDCRVFLDRIGDGRGRDYSIRRTLRAGDFFDGSTDCEDSSLAAALSGATAGRMAMQGQTNAAKSTRAGCLPARAVPY